VPGGLVALVERKSGALGVDRDAVASSPGTIQDPCGGLAVIPLEGERQAAEDTLGRGRGERRRRQVGRGSVRKQVAGQALHQGEHHRDSEVADGGRSGHAAGSPVAQCRRVGVATLVPAVAGRNGDVGGNGERPGGVATRGQMGGQASPKISNRVRKRPLSC
jgi:hypothetical protein